MTTPDPRASSASLPPEITGLPGDPFQTQLIGRLANEIWNEFSRGASAPLPGASIPSGGWSGAGGPALPALSTFWPDADPAALAETAIPTELFAPVPFNAAAFVPAAAAPGASHLVLPSVDTGTDFLPGRETRRVETSQDVPSSVTLGHADPHQVSGTLPPVHPVLDPLEQTGPVPAGSGGVDSGGLDLGRHLRTVGVDSPSFGRVDAPTSTPPAAGGADDWSRIRVVDQPYGADPYAGADFYFLTPGTSLALPGRPATPVARGRSVPATVKAPAHDTVLAGFDVERVRRDFPALHQQVHGHPLVWLDNAATTHKPQSVIDATSDYYAKDNSNIHRAAHTLAERSTDLFEGAREKLRRFIGAAETREIVFVRGTTEAINLVAQSFGRAHIGAGDEIIVSHIEHHANIVPWQLLAQQTGAVLRVAPVNDRGELILEQFAALLNGRTKLVSITHVANALGTINPIEEIIALAHGQGVPVLVDAAQSSPHIPLNVQALDADFLVLSGHKVFGPTGIGILYGKAALLENLPPWQGGGHMIKDVTFSKTIFNGIPEKFEAGTPDIAGAVGLGAAVDYLESVGLPAIAAYEHELLAYATDAISTVRGLRIIGTARNKASVLSFVLRDRDTEQVARFLDKRGIATRSGHHCAQPALRRFGVETTVRASLALYNTREDVDALVEALHALPRN